jgi:hypothetical protein
MVRKTGPDVTEIRPALSRLFIFTVCRELSVAAVLAFLELKKLGLPAGLVDVTAFGILVPAFVILGLWRSMRVNVTVDDAGVRYRNTFRDHIYTWLEIQDITLKRFGSRIPTQEETAATMPRYFNSYGRPHAVTLTLAGGRLSPVMSGTSLIDRSARAELLNALEKHGAAHGVPLRIRNPNRGDIFGVGWDIRLGEGIIAGASPRRDA